VRAADPPDRPEGFTGVSKPFDMTLVDERVQSSTRRYVLRSGRMLGAVDLLGQFGRADREYRVHRGRMPFEHFEHQFFDRHHRTFGPRLLVALLARLALPPGAHHHPYTRIDRSRASNILGDLTMSKLSKPTDIDDGRCAYCIVKAFVASLRDDLKFPADVIACFT
jgi:hypothetical protein